MDRNRQFSRGKLGNLSCISTWAGVRDGWKNRDLYLAAGFAAVMDFAVTTLPPPRPQAPATRVLLSHFPYAGDSRDEDCYAQFFSATKASHCSTATSTSRFRERRTKHGTWHINVGVDWWDYAPVAAETLAQHLDDLKHSRIVPDRGLSVAAARAYSCV